MPALSSTLPKEERLYSKKLIDALFLGGRSRSLSAFPLRAVYMPIAAEGSLLSAKPRCKMLVSVPKRCFKHAVQRNRVKRQVREAYRRHKELVAAYPVAVAFIWLDANLRTTEEVETRVSNLLRRIAERMQHEEVAP